MKIIFYSMSIALIISAHFDSAWAESKESPSDLLENPSPQLVEEFFKSAIEKYGVRNMAWSMRLLSEKGLRAEQWRTVILKETGGKKLVIDLSTDEEIVASANQVIRTLGMADFVECRRGELEVVGPFKQRSIDAEAKELAAVASYDLKGRLSSGFASLLSATFLGYLSLGEIHPEPRVSHMTMAFTDAPTWKRMAPYIAAGTVSLVYYLMTAPIKKFWRQKLWNPNRFWSRFVVDDFVHPILVVAIASTFAILPPVVVDYHGMSLVRPFVAMLLSAISLNMLESAITRGIKNGEIHPVSGAKKCAVFSTASALGRSLILNASGGMLGFLIYMGIFSTAVTDWFKVTWVKGVFDRETARILRGRNSIWPGPCRKILRILAKPPNSP